MPTVMPPKKTTIPFVGTSFGKRPFGTGPGKRPFGTGPGQIPFGQGQGQSPVQRPVQRPVIKPPVKTGGPDTSNKYRVPLMFCMFIFFVLGCSIALSLFNLVSIGSNMQQEIRTGNLHNTLTEAHAALRSARHVTDSLPVADVVRHWKNSNALIEKSKIPWDEVPKWRIFMSKSIGKVKKLLEDHPNWSKDLKETTNNIEKTAHPLAQESKEWRESFKNVARAYSDMIVNMYKK